MWKNLSRGLLISILVLISFLFPLRTFASKSDLSSAIDSLTGSLTDETAILIISLDKRDVLYNKNEDKLLNPASTLKLITAATALKYLGANFHFHTAFYITNEDDLYVVGDGDPAFVIEDLREIVTNLTKKGVRHVKDIIINDSYFTDYGSPGLSEDKGHYTPYTGALSLNYNRMTILAKSARRIGELAKVEALSGHTPIEINNRVTTAPKRTAASVKLLPPTDDKPDKFVIYGQVPVSAKTKAFHPNVIIPPLYFASTLKALLQEGGCKVDGTIYRGGKPESAKLLINHESKPLHTIISYLNKNSNNFIAEQLVKILGAKYHSAPGSTAKGVAVLGQYLNGIGFRPNSYNIVNGSGLSYENKVSALQLVKVLMDMYRDSGLWPYFRDSLSIMGRDGTLRHRRNSKLLIDRVYAKTGSVDNVKTIVGIIPSEEQELLGFAIILNGPSNMRGARELQTKILEGLARFRRN